jgi:hypothetical protein
VNGKNALVFRANVAYKAVVLAPGENQVEFRFGSRLFAQLTFLIALNSLFWLCWTARTIWQVVSVA